MSCFNLKKIDLSRYQIEYPTSGDSTGEYTILSEAGNPLKTLEVSYKLLVLQNTDQASFTFDKKFSDIPTVVAGFVNLTNLVSNPGVNVYVESVTELGGVVRTSGPVELAAVSIQAVYAGIAPEQ